MNYALFIDTNIFLDFYRAKNDAQLHLLNRIDELKDQIISTYQIEMEFKKNRQTAILSSLGEMKAPSEGMTAPAFLKESKALGAAKKKQNEIKKHVNTLRNRAKKLMLNPSGVDPVYQTSQRLFKHGGPMMLHRESEDKKRIRRLAYKRFILGYPPRKNSDSSIGDAINWEWVVHVSKNQNCHVIIVSRDTDYGVTLDGSSYLNDWLEREFRSRVSQQRKCLLTGKLTDALKTMDLIVSREEEEGEEAMMATADADAISANGGVTDES